MAAEVAPPTDVGQRAVIVIAAVAGFFLVPFMADAIGGKIINGFLVVLLIGIVLGNSEKWLPYVAGIHQPSTATTTTPTTPNPVVRAPGTYGV